MNGAVREVARKAMQDRGLTHMKLAEELGMPRPQLTRMLSGQSGNVPEGWQKLLDALNLKLIAVSKDED